jgi:hypothetical protein
LQSGRQDKEFSCVVSAASSSSKKFNERNAIAGCSQQKNSAKQLAEIKMRVALSGWESETDVWGFCEQAIAGFLQGDRSARLIVGRLAASRRLMQVRRRCSGRLNGSLDAAPSDGR